jgi:preprotein translocase subunit SecD
MRTPILALVAFASLIVVAPARAERPAVQARVVVERGGTEFPTRDGARLQLGPPLVLEIASARAEAAEVRLELSPPAARELETVTARNQGRRLALVVDGVVQAAPVIRDPIRGGQVSVTLRSADEAAALARALTRK